MNQIIRPVSYNAYVINGIMENVAGGAPLYAGYFFSNCYQTILSFSLCEQNSAITASQTTTLSLYCKRITSTSLNTGGFLHICLWDKKTRRSTQATPELTVSLSGANENSYLLVDISELISYCLHNHMGTLDLVLYPDPNLSSLVAFDSKEGTSPPFLTFCETCNSSNDENCNASATECTAPYRILQGPPGPQGPTGPQGPQGPQGASGTLDTFVQVNNQAFTATVSSSGGNISLTDSALDPEYTTAGFALATTSVSNDTLQILQTGMYFIEVSLIFAFNVPATALNGDGFTVIFTIQNLAGTYTQNLLYEGVTATDSQGLLSSYQLDLSFLYNVSSLPDGLILTLDGFDYNDPNETNPDTLQIGSIILDVIRISNALP